MLDSSKTRRTAGPHGDPVDGELAVLRDKGRREVLDSDARAPRHDDHIGVCMERVQDGIVFVKHQARKIDETSVTLDESDEHGPIGVDDTIPVRSRACWQQFVARDHQPDLWPAKHAYLSHADGTEDSKILRPQDASGLEQRS